MSEKMSFTVVGNEFSLSTADILSRMQNVEPEPVRELFVEVGGTAYPIKQAFAHATGMPRGQFTSHDAMLILAF
jgi:hypothetical protein